MSPISKATGPGYFCVLSEPKPSLPLQEFDDWYNTEHGPLRLKLDFISNGYRYHARDNQKPEWLACYDLTRVSGLEELQYTILAEKRSRRESHLIDHELSCLDRRMYSDLSTRGSDKAPAPVLLAVTMVVRDENVAEVDSWYEEEHIDLLSKIPGWIRSRRFRLVWSQDQEKGKTEMLAVHEFARENGLDGPEHKRAQSTSWRNKVIDMVDRRDKKVWDLHHEIKSEDYRRPGAVNGALNHANP